ncbi:MAG: 4-hydroxy-tetrahydrodipicolinate synthase [Crocinitomix sp.]|jgi:4-hydroxy-tetrahydrodipicolinate synthase
MELNKFKGLGIAMVTPFNAEGNIDTAALKKLTNFLIEGGADYLVVQGTTGESPVLSKAEKQQTLDLVADVNKGKLPIVFGIGGNNTAALVNDLQTYDLSKVDAILSASPYYNKPTQEGIYQHYKTLAEATSLSIILYNVPGRTASNVLPSTTLRLANDFENIIAVKEASGDMEQIMTIIRDKPDDFLVISGDDALTMPFIAAGGNGVISVVGNAFPIEFKNMVAASLNDDMPAARALHYNLLPIIPMLFAEGNPAGVKEVLKLKGICDAHVRLPLVNISDNLKAALQIETDRINNL